jgi:transcriptional regulator with PAS, ATPase and Fis domain
MPLAMHFLQKISKKLGKSLTGFPNLPGSKMLNYHWPGNIRELEHLLERGGYYGYLTSDFTRGTITTESSSVPGLAVNATPSIPMVKPP